MATTAGTTLPMAPAGGMLGTGTVQTFGMTAEDSAITKGDVLIFASEDVDEDNSAPLITTVVGVALEPSSAAKDVILVALALPGQLFEANVIDNASDETGVAADNIGVHRGIIESADGYACIDLNNTTAAQLVARTLGYARQKNVTQDAAPIATCGVGVTNPRVYFVFTNGVFAPDTDT